MALSFTNTKGSAGSKIDAYEYKNSEQHVRLFGGILPRYIYWLKGKNNKDIPVECLAFNRELEKFDRAEYDHVSDFYGDDVKCSWAYAVGCIDPADGKAKVLNLKKKLFQQIIDAAADLGDPTDPETGWDIVFTKKKTGALAFNVEYSLAVLKCANMKRPLTEAEREAIANAKPIDELYPRPTPADVLATLERLAKGGDDSAAPTNNAEQEAVNDLSR